MKFFERFKFYKICVHNGIFHSDDVFSIAILKIIYPLARIIRTRNKKKIDKCHIKIDVGRKYDESKMEFDHHQNDFDLKRENLIPYSSCGLVWKYFYNKLCDKKVFEIVDRSLIQKIDAEDNAFKTYSVLISKPYTSLDMVRAFFPEKQSNLNFDIQFFNCVKFAKKILIGEIKRAQFLVYSEKYLDKLKISKKQKYVVLDEYIKWDVYLREKTNVEFVIYRAISGAWNCQAVSSDKNDLTKIRNHFPKEVAGLEGEELCKKFGMENLIFCHKGLFLLVTKNKKTAIEAVEKILNKN